MAITNKIKLICEEFCTEPLWYKQLHGGLIKELKKRRITYEYISEEDDINSEEIVCIIGMNNTWIEKIITICNENECEPVVLGIQSNHDFFGNYHLISPDIQNVVQKLKKSFAAAKRQQIAIYGVDYSSNLDRERMTVFSKLVDDPADIYTNNGNLETCFQSFLLNVAYYDAVICLNGYAATSLVKKLKKERAALLERATIISCDETFRLSKYNHWISQINWNYEEYGLIAVTLMEMLSSSKVISSTTLRVKANICEIPENNYSKSVSISETDILQEDPEILQMKRIELLMQAADDLDHHILAMLLNNATYAEIADTCYMSERNIKYRVKKYMSLCECETKKQLLDFLKEYLQ